MRTNRDAWAYNFDRDALSQNIETAIEAYDEQVARWKQRKDKGVSVDDFVSYDDAKFSWSEGLKMNLARGRTLGYEAANLRKAIYRPYTSVCLYFDSVLNERRYKCPLIFPSLTSETENVVICATGIGAERPFCSFCK